MMNTVESTVENDRIHLYRQRRYVNNPASDAKNEYHSLVSPIVRSGGLSSDTHKVQIKHARTNAEAEARATAPFLRLAKARNEAAAEQHTDTAAKYMNISQPIIFEVL
jgi:hypothetical protein